VAGCCEHSNEPSSFMRSGESVDQLRSLLTAQGPCFMDLVNLGSNDCLLHVEAFSPLVLQM
jgi:hypothetical protein